MYYRPTGKVVTVQQTVTGILYGVGAKFGWTGDFGDPGPTDLAWFESGGKRRYVEYGTAIPPADTLSGFRDLDVRLFKDTSYQVRLEINSRIDTEATIGSYGFAMTAVGYQLPTELATEHVQWDYRGWGPGERGPLGTGPVTEPFEDGPDTLSFTVNASFQCDEYLWYSYGDDAATVPGKVTDGDFKVYLRPKGNLNISVVCGGAGLNKSLTIPVDTAFAFNKDGSPDGEPFLWHQDSFKCYVDTDSGSVAGTNTVCSVNASGFGINQSLTATESDSHKSFEVKPPWKANVTGVVRDGRGNTVAGTEVTVNGEAKDYPGTYPMVAGSFDLPDVTVPAEYAEPSGEIAPYRQAEEWNGLRIDRDAEFVVNDFSSGWAGEDTVSLNYSGGVLEVVGDGAGSSKAVLDLSNSQFEQLAAMNDAARAAWWTANQAGFSQAVKDWYEATRFGTSWYWFKVGKPLLSGEPHWNFSTYRYLRVKGYADAPTTVTLYMEWDEIVFEEKVSNFPYDPALTRTPKTGSWTLSFGNTSGNMEIDLASVGGQWGFRNVQRIEFRFDNDRTLHLEEMELFERGRPMAHAYDNTSLPDTLTVEEEGKCCLFLTPRSYEPYSSYFGWPTYYFKGSNAHFRDQMRSHEMSVLATEINLQPGFVASIPATPVDTKHFASMLLPVRDAVFPATLKCQRHAGTLSQIYANSGYTARFSGMFGGRVRFMLYDPSTNVPASGVAVEVREDPSGLVIDTGSTGARGDATLVVKKDGDHKAVADVGEPGENDLTETLIARSVWFVALEGENKGFEFVSLDKDFIGNLYMVRSSPTQGLLLSRRLGSEAGFRYNVVSPNTSLVRASVTVCNTQRGKIVAVIADDDTDTFLFVQDPSISTSYLTAMTLAGAKYPFIEYDDMTGQLLVTTWESGTVKLRRTVDFGANFLAAPATVIAGVPEQVVSVKRVHHALYAGYMDGADVSHLRVSTDGGENWADAP